MLKSSWSLRLAKQTMAFTTAGVNPGKRVVYLGGQNTRLDFDTPGSIKRRVSVCMCVDRQNCGEKELLKSLQTFGTSTLKALKMQEMTRLSD